MRRRALIELGAAALAARALPAGAQGVVMIGGPMAGSVYFTRDAPGIWFGEADRHLPEIRTEAAPGDTVSVTILTPHPMEGCRHYIQRHKLLDGRFRLLSQRTFAPEGEEPVSRHVLPAGYRGAIYAASVCNLHDIWIEGTMIGDGDPPPGL